MGKGASDTPRGGTSGMRGREGGREGGEKKHHVQRLKKKCAKRLALRFYQLAALRVRYFSRHSRLLLYFGSINLAVVLPFLLSLKPTGGVV